MWWDRVFTAALGKEQLCYVEEELIFLASPCSFNWSLGTRVVNQLAAARYLIGARVSGAEMLTSQVWEELREYHTLPPTWHLYTLEAGWAS